MLGATYPSDIVLLAKRRFESGRQVLSWCLRCQCSANGGNPLVSDKLQCKDSERDAEDNRRLEISAKAICKQHAASEVVARASSKARTSFPGAFCCARRLLVWNGRRLYSSSPPSPCASHRCQLDIFAAAVVLGTPLEWACCLSLTMQPHLPREQPLPRIVLKCFVYFYLFIYCTFQMSVETIQLEGLQRLGKWNGHAQYTQKASRS